MNLFTLWYALYGKLRHERGNMCVLARYVERANELGELSDSPIPK